MANYIQADIKCPCGHIAGTKHFYEGQKSSGTCVCQKCHNLLEWQCDGKRITAKFKK